MVDVVRTLKDAIILSQLRDKPRTSVEIAASMNIVKSSITKSLRNMKRSGLVKGRGYYFLTDKGKIHFYGAYKKISGVH